jgi:hypothetical protein
MLVAVTDHAAERFRQRVGGTLDAKTEIVSRVARAHAAGRVERDSRGGVLVRDRDRRDLVYVCRPEGSELVVVTLWEEGEEAAVPKRFTDALRRDDHRVTDAPVSGGLPGALRAAGPATYSVADPKRP